MRVLVCFWFSAFCFGEQRTSELDGRYFDSIRQYVGPSSSILTCLEEQEREGVLYENHVRFITVGLEGSGHHIIESLPVSIAGTKRAGGQVSIPYGFNWRQKPHANISVPLLNSVQKYQKILILIRDPVDSWLSALSRFWNENRMKEDTIRREFEALNFSISAFHKVIQRIPCKQRLYLPYELIIHEPEITKIALSAFFLRQEDRPLHELSEQQAMLTSWVYSKRSKEENLCGARNLTTMTTRSACVQWPGPYSVDCKRKYAALIQHLFDHFNKDEFPPGWNNSVLCLSVLDSCNNKNAIILAFFRDFISQIENLVHIKIRTLNPQIEAIPAHRMTVCT